MEWFYANGGTKVGPVTPLAFEGLVKDKTVGADSLVWSKGQADWQPWGKIAGETAVCAASGGRYWQRDMAPYEGQFVSAEHKAEYFQRLREGVVQPGQLVYAGFWVRFLAKFIDGIVNWVISTVLNLGLAAVLLGAVVFNPKPVQAPSQGAFFAYQAATVLLGIVTGLLYYWFFLTRKGATLGKMALGLKVVRSDGAPITSGRAIGRYFAEWLSSMILAMGYIMAAFDDEKRALHDRVCDTRVIKSR